MRKGLKLRKSILSGVVAVAMVGSLSFAPALASAQQEYAVGAASADVPEWAVDDGENVESGITTQAALPIKYDLRSEGLVTPVKFQNPWGSCWAFGGMSAAEISLLSASGEVYGAEADSSHAPLDLSERHLTYFALQPVTASIDPNQIGEGLHTYDPPQAEIDKNPYAADNAAYDAGGLPVYITTLFAQGVGPVPEKSFPYYGPNGKTTAQDYAENDDHLTMDAIAQLTMMAEQSGMTYEEFMETTAAARGKTVEELLESYKKSLLISSDEATGCGSYTKYDDWSIPETDSNGHANRLLYAGYVLKDGNVLPEYWNADKTELQQDGVDAIKQEVLNGHGVNIAFHADQSGTFTMSDVDEKGNSVDNWYNQYVDQPLRVDHGVCIVGWDDSYAADNFKTTAPGDGAWIVKNSWGSTKDAVKDELGNVVGKRNYGMKDANGEYTGCFYLSYYDKTISKAETMEFSANLGSEGVFATLQHDYMPASQEFYTSPETSNVMSSANVFSTDDAAITVKAISTRTAETNMRVTFAIYELNENAADPTDGKLLYRTSRNFEYGGYHRLDLDQPVSFDKNKKFSVVSTTSVVNPDGSRLYSTSASRGVTKHATDIAREGGFDVKAYSEAVVNKGESYLYIDGAWQDWKDYLEALDADAYAKDVLPTAEKYLDACTVDNFSIKVYVEPKSDDSGKTDPTPTVKTNPMTVKAKQVTAKAKKKTTIAATKAFEVKDAKGAVAFYKESGNAKIAVNKAGKVTVKKGLKKGKTYKVKVLVTAAGDKNYTPAMKTVTLKVKAK